MDPMMKMYMFHHYLEDINEQVELFKHHGYLIGSFINPEAAKELMSKNTYATSDEDFEETSRMVAESNRKSMEQENKSVKRRRRKKIT